MLRDFFGSRRNRENSSKIALHVDLQPVSRRRQEDPVHQRP
jgi:hypothetical protein